MLKRGCPDIPGFGACVSRRNRMAKQIVVSFEHEDVRIVYASGKRGSYVVEKAFTINESDLDAFLREEKSREFIVVSSFAEFFVDTIAVPPAKDSVIRVLLEKEVRKRSRMDAFSFVYSVVGEKTIDKKRLKEVFVFAVAREFIRDIVDRFARHGKIVTALYPDILAAAGLIGKERYPLMGMIETGSIKKIFLVHEGRVLFVRVVQSAEHGVGEQDMQNIVMTVNYCKQTMKVTPRLTMLLGHVCTDFTAHPSPQSPVATFLHPLLTGAASGPDFFCPLAALLAEHGSSIDLLPPADRTVFQADKTLRLLTLVFCVAMFFCVLQLGLVIGQIVNVRQDITERRAWFADMQGVLERYYEKKERFELYRPYLAAYRNYADTPDTYRFLHHLTALDLENIQIESISIGQRDATAPSGGAPAGKSPPAILAGRVEANSYARMRTSYKELISSIEKLESISIIEKELNLKNGTFTVTMKYE